MIEQQSSKTAMGAAVLRAAHQIMDGDPKILDDPIIQRLLDSTALDQIRQHPESLQNPRNLALRSHILVRSRFAEDQLAIAVKRGIRQLIILGAGMDTFAYRQPAWAKILSIIEVDQPSSQQEKKERLEKAGVPIPDNLKFITVDFEKEEISNALIQGGFDPKVPSFISWLGVMVYLSQEAIETVFRFAASLPESSEMVFTFASVNPEPDTKNQPHTIRSRVAGLGEPWLSFHTPEELETILRRSGFSQIDFLTPDEINNRYMNGRQDGLEAFGRTNTASVRV